jgi:CRISPR type IV-associated protein Csf2
MNTQTYTVVLNGTITTESPLATCPPKTETEKRAEREKNPPSRLPRMTVGNAETVYFPGSGLRGKLRRHALTVVRRAVQGDGAPVFTLDDHYFNVVGGIKDKGSDSKADIIAAANLRAANPLISLFGSMAAHTAGKLMVSHAVPEQPTEPDKIAGIRSDDMERTPDTLNTLADGERDKWLSMSEEGASNSKAKAELKNIETALRKAVKNAKGNADAAAEVAELSAKRDALKGQVEAAGVNIKQVLGGYEVIPQGKVLNQRMVLRNVTKLELGLFLAALRELALDPVVGAHANHGCGVISGTWTVTVREGDGFANVGSVQIEPFGGLELLDTGIIASALAAWDATDVTSLNFRAP